MMEVIELLHAKLNIGRRVLSDLVKHYQQLNDDERLEKSNIVMDQVNSYLQIKENLLFPIIARTGEHDDLISRSCEAHHRIEQLTEHAIMMHVDEPGFEYYDHMARLLGLLDLVAQIDSETILPWAKLYLSEEDQYQVITHLKEQTLHESSLESEYGSLYAKASDV